MVTLLPMIGEAAPSDCSGVVVSNAARQNYVSVHTEEQPNESLGVPRTRECSS